MCISKNVSHLITAELSKVYIYTQSESEQISHVSWGPTEEKA